MCFDARDVLMISRRLFGESQHACVNIFSLGPLGLQICFR